jgi:formylglycine-generating enzyme required for sulfatase activity
MVMPGNGRIFISHTHNDNERCLPLLAALDAWDADYWFDTQRMDAGTELTDAIQRAISERDIFIRVATAETANSYWMNKERDAFMGLQAAEYHQGQRDKRHLILLRLDAAYQIQPLEHGTIWIEAAGKPMREWIAALRRALGVTISRTVPDRDRIRDRERDDLPPPPPPPPDSIAQQLIAGIASAYDAGDWPLVVDRSRLLLSRRPDAVTPAVYRMRGIALLRLSPPDAAGAREALTRALAKDGLDVPTLRAAAQAAILLGHPDEARPLLNDAVGVPGIDTATRIAILREYLPVLAALDTPDARAEQLRRADEALRLASDDPDLLRARRDALARLGRDGDALALARQLTAGDAATADDWLVRVRLARTGGDLIEATQALLALARLGAPETTIAPEREATLTALRTQRESLMERQQWAPAVALVEAELALRPGDRERELVRARLLDASGDHEQALALAQTLEAGAQAPGDWLDLGLLYVSLARPAEAWSCAQRSGLLAGAKPDERLGQRALALLRATTKLHGTPDEVWPALARLILLIEHKNDEAWVALASGERAGAAPALIGRAREELFPPPSVAPSLARLGFAGRNLAGTAVVLPPVCPVPAGPFLMGSDPKQDSQAYDFEQPQQQVSLAAFAIGRFPVTVAEYACFVATGHAVPGDWSTQQGKLDHPVVQVSWHDAMAYAAWLARLTGQPWALPSEAQWEKAARWDPARRASRLYPWGDRFEAARCNTSESGIKTTTAVGSYGPETPARDGSSPCGAQDMAGNVWEWTSTLYKPYPYTESDGRENPNSTENRVLRGGSWFNIARNACAACRYNLQPDSTGVDIGFRVALLSAAPNSF